MDIAYVVDESRAFFGMICWICSIDFHTLHFKYSHVNVNNIFLHKIAVDSSIFIQHSYDWTEDADAGLYNGMQ